MSFTRLHMLYAGDHTELLTFTKILTKANKPCSPIYPRIYSYFSCNRYHLMHLYDVSTYICSYGHLIWSLSANIVPIFPNHLSSSLSLAISLHCNENSIYVFPEKELHGLSPSFYIYVSLSDLYISRISPHIFLQQNRQTVRRNI